MVNLALIGVGRWGQKILQEAHFLSGVKITHLCSPHVVLKKVSGNFTKLTDYRDLAKIPSIDGVIIAVPPSLHFEIISYFISRKINIFVEKPMVTSFADANKIKSLLEGKNIVFRVGHVYLHNEAFITFAKLVKKENSIKSFKIVLTGPDEFDSMRALWEWAPHALSMLSAICGRKVTSIDVSVPSLGKVVMQIRYGLLTVEIIIGSGYKLKKRFVTITTDRKKLIFNERSVKKVIVTENNITYYPSYARVSPLQRELESF
ncbi:MAG: Gfo/Idh/MocA family oxidoreductase, partial [Candidatus Levybacteria bacterium]|nr:Gfo/Idh/MocA family oxidoreductase [Candidatus Levybacteria bacterium]